MKAVSRGRWVASSSVMLVKIDFYFSLSKIRRPDRSLSGSNDCHSSLSYQGQPLSRRCSEVASHSERLNEHLLCVIVLYKVFVLQGQSVNTLRWKRKHHVNTSIFHKVIKQYKKKQPVFKAKHSSRLKIFLFSGLEMNWNCFLLSRFPFLLVCPLAFIASENSLTFSWSWRTTSVKF